MRSFQGVYRFVGDSNDNRTVDAADFNAYRQAFGGSNVIFDFNGDGTIDANDFDKFQTNFGYSI
jgi:hypothetical protein